MTVRLSADGVIMLEGPCPSGDAEVLLRFILQSPGAAVDWSACDHAHTSVVQVLLAARPRMVGSPQAALLSRWIDPALRTP